MESRYALRELESAIGYDCRRLEDGRAAIFRHTGLHRHFRRDYYERRDAVAYFRSMVVAIASRSAGKKDGVEEVEDMRQSLVRSMFPYMHIEPVERHEENYDDLFDELDAIYNSRQKSESSNDDAECGKVSSDAGAGP